MWGLVHLHTPSSPSVTGSVSRCRELGHSAYSGMRRPGLPMCHLVRDTELIVGTVPAAAHKLDNEGSDKLPQGQAHVL